MSPAEAQAERPEAPALPAPGETPTLADTTQDAEIAALRRELAAFRRRLAVVPFECAQRVSASGGVEPVEWPEGESASDHARVLADAIAKCPDLSDVPVELDCSEYPCAVFAFGSRGVVESCGPLLDAASQLSTQGFSLGSALTGGVAVHGMFLLPSPSRTPELAGAAEDRRMLRMKLAAEANAEFE